MSSNLARLDPADRGHGGWATRRRAGTALVTVVVVSLAVASAGGEPVTMAVTGSTSPPGSKPTLTVAPAGGGGTGVFTFGDITIPPGEPDQLLVVLGGRIDDEGHLPIVVRNNREGTVYDVYVGVVGYDASGTEVGVADYFIPTAGLAPGDWVFGQNAVPAPGLAEATNLQLELGGSGEPAGFVGLDVTAAEVVGRMVEGTVVNTSPVTLSDFILIDVACFDDSTITSYESVMPDLVLSRLGPGEAAHFATTTPIDPASCTAIAVHAIGMPES
jgi:hypothetical protein